jgi:hypothetical protein
VLVYIAHFFFGRLSNDLEPFLRCAVELVVIKKLHTLASSRCKASVRLRKNLHGQSLAQQARARGALLPCHPSLPQGQRQREHMGLAKETVLRMAQHASAWVFEKGRV